MLLQLLSDLKHAECLLSKHWLHLLVRDDVPLVVGVLKLLSLDVVPDPLVHLQDGELLPLLYSHQFPQLRREGQRLAKSSSRRGHL